MEEHLSQWLLLFHLAAITAILWVFVVYRNKNTKLLARFRSYQIDLEYLPIGIIRSDVHLNIIHLNRVAQELLGVAPIRDDKPVNYRITDCIDPKQVDEVLDSLLKPLVQGKVSVTQVQVNLFLLGANTVPVRLVATWSADMSNLLICLIDMASVLPVLEKKENKLRAVQNYISKLENTVYQKIEVVNNKPADYISGTHQISLLVEAISEHLKAQVVSNRDNSENFDRHHDIGGTGGSEGDSGATGAAFGRAADVSESDQGAVGHIAGAGQNHRTDS